MTSLLWSLVVALVCTGVAMAADENYDISVKVVTPKKTLATHVKSFGTVRKVFSGGCLYRLFPRITSVKTFSI